MCSGPRHADSTVEEAISARPSHRQMAVAPFLLLEMSSSGLCSYHPKQTLLEMNDRNLIKVISSKTSTQV